MAWVVLSRLCVKWNAAAFAKLSHLWLEQIHPKSEGHSAICWYTFIKRSNSLSGVTVYLFYLFVIFKGFLMGLLTCIVCAVAVSHCCSHSKSCGCVVELKLQGLSPVFFSTDFELCLCYAVSLPVLEKLTGWFRASGPICSLGTVTSLFPGVWRTLPRFCDSRVCVSVWTRSNQRRLTHTPNPPDYIKYCSWFTSVAEQN